MPQQALRWALTPSIAAKSVKGLQLHFSTMKFSHALKFNSVSEWKAFYIDYVHLKRFVYQLEAAAVTALPETPRLTSLSLVSTLGDVEAGEEASGPSPLVTDAAFVHALERELEKIVTFYAKKEQELVSQIENAETQAREFEARQYTRSRRQGHGQSTMTAPEGGRRVGDEGAVDLREPLLGGKESSGLGSGAGPDSTAQRVWVWQQEDSGVRLAKERLRLQMTDLYVQLFGLQDYIDLNRTGFRKILKKHAKVTHHALQSEFMPRVNVGLDKKHEQQQEAALARVVQLYSIVCCNGSSELARLELKRHLRDHLVWERNTVWQDMVSKERRSASAHVYEEKTAWYLRCLRPLSLLLAVGVLVALLVVPVFPEAPKQNCLALLAFVSLLWCTETIPLYTTSMLVPLLAVVLRVLVDSKTGRRLSPQEAASAIFHTMFSEVIMLLLGGFAIASALSKYFIAKRLATTILSRVGQAPQNVLLASMLVASFLSMWISNVAAPVLCFSLVQPILRTLPSGHPYGRALVMGIALASNLGGMASPISSPQNIFAIEELSLLGDPPSWLQWFVIALPICLVGNIGCWALLLAAYAPHKQPNTIRPLKPTQDPITLSQVYVVVVSVVTVALWCANSWLRQYLGQMGVVAVVPLVAFFGTGILTKDDFNNFLWNVVMLAMGGLALGECVTSSGLLHSIAASIQATVANLGPWQVAAVFCGLVLVATTFISHTVGAMVILPIVMTVGSAMPDPHPKLLVMASVLMCSGAMGLPVSGFPNMNAIALEDGTGKTYLTTLDFLWVGIPSSLLAYGIIITLGYGIMEYIVHW